MEEEGDEDSSNDRLSIKVYLRVRPCMQEELKFDVEPFGEDPDNFIRQRIGCGLLQAFLLHLPPYTSAISKAQDLPTALGALQNLFAIPEITAFPLRQLLWPQQHSRAGQQMTIYE